MIEQLSQGNEDQDLSLAIQEKHKQRALEAKSALQRILEITLSDPSESNKNVLISALTSNLIPERVKRELVEKSLAASVDGYFDFIEKLAEAVKTKKKGKSAEVGGVNKKDATNLFKGGWRAIMEVDSLTPYDDVAHGKASRVIMVLESWMKSEKDDDQRRFEFMNDMLSAEVYREYLDMVDVEWGCCPKRRMINYIGQLVNDVVRIQKRRKDVEGMRGKMLESWEGEDETTKVSLLDDLLKAAVESYDDEGADDEDVSMGRLVMAFLIDGEERALETIEKMARRGFDGASEFLLTYGKPNYLNRRDMSLDIIEEDGE